MLDRVCVGLAHICSARGMVAKSREIGQAVELAILSNPINAKC